MKVGFVSARFNRMLWCTIISMVFPSIAQAQQELDERQRKEVIERIIETKEGGADYTDLMDQLDYFLKNPIELNHCTKEDLQKLGFLKEFQIDHLFAHRTKFGDLISVYELQVVDGFDPETIRQLLPFVRVSQNWKEDHISLPGMLRKGMSRVVWLNQRQVEENEGQRRRRIGDTLNGKSYYQGNPLRSVLRYQYVYKNRLSIAFTGEKDAGEAFLRGANPRGFDFNSGHISLSEFGHLKKLVIGDYNFLLGQGLTFGSGLSFGKSAQVLNVKRNLNGIRPYRSVNENEFLRGFAIALQFKHTEFTVFGSSRKLDANIGGDTIVTSEDQSFSSIISSGTHRTATEIANKHVLGQWVGGGEFVLKWDRLRLGFTSVYTHFNTAREPSSKPYNQFAFSGTDDIKGGINYNWSYRNFNFFGETARNLNSTGSATINALLISLSSKADLILVYRNYGKDYKPQITNAFGETTTNANENGFYSGISTRLGRGFAWNGYIDVYSFPWLRYQVNVPGSQGFDYLTEVNYTPGKTVNMYLRFRGEHKQGNFPNNEAAFDYLSYRNHNSTRFQVQVKANTQLVLTSRFEASRFQQANTTPEKGVMIYQDADLKLFKSKLSISTRFTFFNIDGFNSRIYAYENDMLYTFSVPAFQNKGVRYFIMVSFKIYRNLKCSLKFAQTSYTNIQTVGSGLDLTHGSTRTDVKVQLQWNL